MAALLEEAMNSAAEDSTSSDELRPRQQQPTLALTTTEQRTKLATFAVLLPSTQSRKNEAIVFDQEDGKFRILMTEPENGNRRNWVAKILRVAPGQLETSRITHEQYDQLYGIAYRGRQGEVIIDRAQSTREANGARVAKESKRTCTKVPAGETGARTWQSVASQISKGALTNFTPAQVVEQIDENHLRHMQDFAKSLMQEAYRSGASDIHIEPGVHRGSIRFRLDGMLRPHIEDVPREELQKLINTLAVMAKIPAHRLLVEPHDANISIALTKTDGTLIHTDYRATFVPANEMVKATLRQNAEFIADIRKIGFEPTQLEVIYRALESPNGLLLITGPTGSGKSNTLESILTLLEEDATRAIYQICDPVEFRSPKRTQVEITPENDWHKILRAALRSDPDIISPAEFRDAEQAKKVIESANTGHLVPATFHTNDVASTFTRLSHLGINEHEQAETLIAIIAQRLVRLLCPECKRAEPRMKISDGIYAYAPVGCHSCKGTGYRGRTALTEVLYLTPRLKRMVEQGATGTEIVEEAARSQGMMNMIAVAGLKIARGETSFEEVKRCLRLEPRETDDLHSKTRASNHTPYQTRPLHHMPESSELGMQVDEKAMEIEGAIDAEIADDELSATA